MEKLLRKCDKMAKDLPCCHGFPPEKCNCYKCISNGLWGGQDTYTCLKKLCHYTMNYGPSYVSEIYHFLAHSKILEDNFYGKRVRILSLGCGFGPDLIGVVKYIRDNRLDVKVEYHGLDKEPLWSEIRRDIIPEKFFEIRDVAGNYKSFSVSSYNMIFLSKLFSTLKNHNLDGRFLNILEFKIKTHMKHGSFLVFNDVNSIYKGRDAFHHRISSHLPNSKCYFFNVNGAWSYDYYEEIARTGNICDIPSDISVSPKRGAMQSVFFLYRK